MLSSQTRHVPSNSVLNIGMKTLCELLFIGVGQMEYGIFYRVPNAASLK